MKVQKALLVVDMQNDFCPGGALGIPEGDKIIPAVNKYLKIFSKKKIPVILTRDWHPIKTAHFRDFGGVWPVHCIHNSKGASFHPNLKLPREPVFVYKGMDPEKDSYSAFQSEDEKGVGLPKLLKLLGVQEIYIAGLATDYCVKFTTHDALKHGFKVRILMDAIKGVDLKVGDSEKAIKGLIKEGAKKMILKDFSRWAK